VLFYDVDRHDEFHGTFRGHYETHGGANAGGNALMHGADTELDKLTGSIEAEAEFLASHSHTARAVVDFVKKIDHEIKVATNNNLDLKIVFAVGIICLTVFEVGATAATPSPRTSRQAASSDSRRSRGRKNAGRRKRNGAGMTASRGTRRH